MTNTSSFVPSPCAAAARTTGAPSPPAAAGRSDAVRHTMTGVKRLFPSPRAEPAFRQTLRGVGHRRWSRSEIDGGARRGPAIPPTMPRRRAICSRFRTPSACARRRPAPVAACANDGATTTGDSTNGTTGTGELRYMIDVADALGNSQPHRISSAARARSAPGRRGR